jgi:RimJ/RimL family protein N-acetyltransferase
LVGLRECKQITLKIAEHEDIPDIFRMCLSFKEASPYSFLPTSDSRIRQTIYDLIEGDRSRRIVLLAVQDRQNVGMVAGIANEFLFSDDLVAGEIVWWLDKDFRRGTTHGRDLHTAFEYWAKNVAKATAVSMALLENKDAPKIAKLYERNGYSLLERAFLKKMA